MTESTPLGAAGALSRSSQHPGHGSIPSEFSDAELRDAINGLSRSRLAGGATVSPRCLRRRLHQVGNLLERFRQVAASGGIRTAIASAVRVLRGRWIAWRSRHRREVARRGAVVDPFAIVGQRLAAALDALGVTRAAVPTASGDLLTLVEAARRARPSRETWLLFVVLTGAFPRPEQLIELERALELARSTPEAARDVLALLAEQPDVSGSFTRPLHVVASTIVDVTLSAQTDHNTGIQRVVRAIGTQWSGHEGLEFVAWDDDHAVLRSLTWTERRRLLHWGAGSPAFGAQSAAQPVGPAQFDGADSPIVVPLDADVVVAEVPALPASERLAGVVAGRIARLHAIGYDAIPVISADLVPQHETEKFASYLGMLASARTVAAISAAAATEFGGYVSALRVQGLVGPRVRTVSLPSAPVGGDVDHRDAEAAVQTVPLVVAVGSHEPRKNHRALLFAAEMLWRDGVAFELLLVGRGSTAFLSSFDREIRALQRAGRPLRVQRDADDRAVRDAYRNATVIAFPSLHEGFGLPIVEALSCGTPVITSNYGSMAELGVQGGCVLVDPRDDTALVSALRRVVTDPQVRADLRAEILARPSTTWPQYAADLWRALDLGGEQD